MAKIQDLPELVVLGVFKHPGCKSLSSLPNLKKRLSLISINNSWRKWGLPLLYGTLIFNYCEIKSKTPVRGRRGSIISYDISTKVKQNSNVGLFRSTQHKELARGLVMCRSDSYSELINLNDVLREFTISLFNMLFLGQCGDSLSSTTDTLFCLSVGNKYADETAKALTFSIVTRFVEMFPNVKNLDIMFGGFQSNSKYIAQSLLNGIPQPFHFLRCELPESISYATYPTNVQHLVCGNNKSVMLYFPKQYNKAKLESLKILNPSCNLSWQEPDQRDKTIVFPILHKLTLECYQDTSEDLKTTKQNEHSRFALPDFSILRYFKLHVANRDSIEFITGSIPSYLEKVVLSGNALAAVVFGKLPVKSIGYLEVHISGDLALVTDEFYRAVDHLFNDIETTYCSNVSLSSTITGLYNEKIHWKHVDRLELTDTGFNRIVGWLEKLPNLKYLKINYINSRPDQGNAAIEGHTLDGLENCKLQTLVVNNTSGHKIAQYMTDVTMCLMRSVKHLGGVYINEN